MKKPVLTLYIIHGWTYTTAPWAKTLALLEKKGVKVEMLNVPGLTSSSKKVWTIEDYVKWADRKIPKGAIALGHSNGGRILLNLCSTKPDKLKQLILLDAAGVYEPSKKRDLTRSISKHFGFLKRIPGVAKIWHKLTGASDYAKAPANMKKTLTNMLDSDRHLQLERVTTPTSILWGEQDQVTPPRQAAVMHEKLPNSDLKMFPGWTHAPYISHPEQLAQAILQVIKHPPLAHPTADNVAATSAALALKRAPEPVLTAKGDQNPVAPNVPTKLVLRKDDSTITKGLVISDAEGAAVKYQPKKPEIASKVTDASAISASANLKKAVPNKTPKGPALNTVNASASAVLKKTAKKAPVTDAAVVSAALALEKKAHVDKTPAPDPQPSIVAELEQKTVGEVGFVPLEPTASGATLPEGSITSASVPKVSRIEQAKRKARAVRAKSKARAKAKAKDSANADNTKAKAAAESEPKGKA